MPSVSAQKTVAGPVARPGGGLVPRVGRLERYVLRELAVPLVLTLVVASVVLLSGEFLTEIIDKWLNRGLNAAVAARVALFLVPPLFLYTLPLALLLAVLITFGRMSEDHEIVAIQAAGVSWGRLFAPAVAVALLATALNVWLAGSVVPQSQALARDYLIRTMLRNPTLLLEAQTWLSEVEDMHVWIGGIDDERGALHDLRIYRDDDAGNMQTIQASSGRIDIDLDTGEVALELQDGAVHQAGTADPSAYELIKFKRVRIPFPVYAIERWVARVSAIKTDEKTFGQLREDARQGGAWRRKAWTEIGRRTSMPFACLTFVLAAAPLSIRPHKSLRAYGIGVCIALTLCFYLLYSLGSVLSRQEIIHPLLGLWMPNLFLGAAGGVAMVRLWRR